MEYKYALERHDYSRINKLNKLNDINNYWDDVRKLTKRITSDHAIRRWQCLSEIRYGELKESN